MNVNNVLIIGRLTRDPEMRTIPSGMNITSFSVATSRTWYDKEKQKQEETEYHNIVAFGKQAETINQYAKKGALIQVEGRLKTQSWEDKETKKKMYRTEIMVERFQFGPKAASTNGSGGNDGGRTREDDGFDPGEINPEDIPF